MTEDRVKCSDNNHNGGSSESNTDSEDDNGNDSSTAEDDTFESDRLSKRQSVCSKPELEKPLARQSEQEKFVQVHALSWIPPKDLVHVQQQSFITYALYLHINSSPTREITKSLKKCCMFAPFVDRLPSFTKLNSAAFKFGTTLLEEGLVQESSRQAGRELVPDCGVQAGSCGSPLDEISTSRSVH
ncbi:MAG: hypothetical protein J3Q66DRAFT_372183 [Benniella sp.]|nr:MAG: hypothetical protein J3Q66DRAFT_372183 [Benniella sp.]